MPKKFNVTGDCKPKLHYMVDLQSRLKQIKALVDDGQYFTINKGRQYGKTTTLRALRSYLQNDYDVILLDFQKQMSPMKLADESLFSAAMVNAVKRELQQHAELFEHAFQNVTDTLNTLKNAFSIVELFDFLTDICSASDKPIVLMIDEVDQAADSQVFISFLSQLRGAYIDRDETPTFQSVILTGVHDIRNLRQKVRGEETHVHNSPWNIAARFDVDMSFSPADIAGMLNDYENDHHSGMDIRDVSQLIYDYTSGYPVLVSMICKLIDESVGTQKLGWNATGIKAAVKQILGENFPLLESLMNKLEQFPDLKASLAKVLEEGRKVAYNPDDEAIKQALMYGFVKVEDGNVVMANRIFETRFYNAILTTPAMQNTTFYKAGETEKPEFVKNGKLDMGLVLMKFVEHYLFVYGEHPEKFVEDDGRKLFMLYLKPIINGTGTYYIEPQTRDHKRMDLVVDYLGQQFVVELKIWHGDEYNTRGEQQLLGYLDYFHLQQGYMLSFNFNQKKQTGVHTVQIGDRTIIEAVV